MHFCFVIQGFLHDRAGKAIQGPLVQTFLIGRELARRGIRVSYLCLSTTRRAVEREHHAGIDVIYVPVPNLPMRLSEPRLFPQVGALLRSLRPDVVYTRGRTSLPYVVARYTERHDAVAIWNAARDRDFNRSQYITMKTRKLRAPMRQAAWFSYTLTMNWLFERGVRATDVRFVQNREQAEAFARLFGSTPQIIPSAVEIPEELPRKSDPVEVLWIAGVKPEKRPELFLEVVRRLAHLPIVFTMAGALIDKRYRSQIEETLRINPRFRFLGLIPYDRTAEYFGSASLFVNTSMPGVEGFPNAFLQAWAAGTPVLSMDCDPGGVLGNGLGGVYPDVEALIGAIRLRIDDPALLDAERRRARSYVEERHSPARVVSLLLEAVEATRKKIPAPVGRA